MPDRATLDPQLRAMLDAFAAADAPPIEEQTPKQARAAYALISEVSRPDYDPLPMAVRDEVVARVPVRSYTPPLDGDAPTTVFFHGGGFVLGDLDGYDAQCRRLAHDARTRVVSVGYRLAPEHRYPTAHEDCYAVTRALAAECGPVGVAGDSAGGNLAASVALRARDDDVVDVRAQLLIYPWTDADLTAASIRENAAGYLLTAAHIRWFAAQYVPDPDDRHEPQLSVFHAPDLTGLAPAVVATAGFDPLRDEGDAYAQRLGRAGVEVVHLRYPALTHLFMWFGGVSPAAAAARDEVHRSYAALLHR